ncbi:MAG TPA: DUF4339 domain-containing protein, partial [Bacteroidia bacterium]|nr:DUF4339 domain-containing protein [Bacteroidia bacterium]
MSSEATWYYECNGERKGPVATETIVDLHSKGELGADTLVWREGMPDWAALNTTELASAVGAVRRPPALGAAAPPPVPNAVVPFVPRTARLRDDFRPAIRSSYGRAWELLKTRFWPLVGCFTLSMLIMSVASQFYIPAFFLMFPIVGGLYWYILKCIRGEAVTMESLFEGFRRQFGALA